MEQTQMEQLAETFFQMIPLEEWQGQNADAIEQHLQKRVMELGRLVLEKQILPRRVAEIEQQVEEGSLRCTICESAYHIHKHGLKLTLKSLFGGKIRLERTQYECPVCQRYPKIADEVLGLVGHRLTPRLALMVALCGASWSYEIAVAFIQFFLGVSLSSKTAWQVSVSSALLPTPLAPELLNQPPGVAMADGVVIHAREKDRWWEMKVASFFSQIAELSPTRRAVMDASFVAGAMEKWEDFEPRFTEEAQRRGLKGLETIEFVADGAEGIWQMQEMVFPFAQKRLDEFHLQKKVSQRTQEAYALPEESQKHRQELITSLHKGELQTALTYLQQYPAQAEEQQQALNKLQAYLKRHQERIPDYEQVRQEGGTVSSGLGEKANDLIVVRRLKEGTMHWSREGADPVLLRRVNFINAHARDRPSTYETAFCFH